MLTWIVTGCCKIIIKDGYLSECSCCVILVNKLHNTNQCSSNQYWMTKDGMCSVASLDTQ